MLYSQLRTCTYSPGDIRLMGPQESLQSLLPLAPVHWQQDVTSVQLLSLGFFSFWKKKKGRVVLKSLNDYAQVRSDSALDSRSRADGRDTESSEVQILKASYLALKHLTYSELANYRSKMQPISTKAWNRLVLKLWEDMSQQLGRKHICFRQAHSEIPAQVPCTHASQLILTSMVMGIANSLSTLPTQRQQRKKWEKKEKRKRSREKEKDRRERGENDNTIDRLTGSSKKRQKKKKIPRESRHRDFQSAAWHVRWGPRSQRLSLCGGRVWWSRSTAVFLKPAVEKGLCTPNLLQGANFAK